MADISFIVQILASTLAVAASYGLVMTVLKRELNYTWLQSETLVTLAAAALATAFAFNITIIERSAASLTALALLILGFGAAFILTLINRFRVKKDPEADTYRGLLKILAIMSFSSFTLHLLLELAAIAWY